ncbi:lipoprotein-releasing ABC transporter permease subunit LolE [Testudinibacter sp. P27/CKL/0425]
MKIPFFIAWRYQRGKQKNRLVSLISAFSTIGIALGVAVLIIGLSAMNGFERELRQRVLAVVPNIEISAYQNAAQPSEIQNWQNLAQRLDSQPIVKGIAPYVSFTALIENGSRLKVAQLRGVEKALQDKVSAIGQFVQDNQWTNFNAQSGLILGAGITRELDVNVGDSVSLLLSQGGDSMTNNQPKRFRLEVSGILRLDGQLDHSFALLPIETAREYLGMSEQQASGVEIALFDPFKVNQMDYSSLQDYPQQLTATSWLGKFGYMYRDIQMIRSVMYIAMVLVIGVACFNIVSTLIMAVKDKQGDIAIMRTLGANNGFIRRIFISYGLLSGMKGCVIGIIIGILLALNLTEIIKAIESLLQVQLLSDGIYFVDFLPSELHWQDVGLVLLSALMLSLLASLYPAARAAKLQPAAVLSSY